MRSDCCGAKIYAGTDICSECLEHTGQDNHKTGKPKTEKSRQIKTK